MNKILTFISFAFSFLSATVINVPSEFTTVQEGIDAASTGDTVLIAQGTYHENLFLEKEIVLASNAINDELSSEWLLNENIVNTIISAPPEPVNSKFGSCLVIRNSQELIEPTILGLTFSNGQGTSMRMVDCAETADKSSKMKAGGAILIFKAYPKVHYNRFVENGPSGPQIGGGNTATNSIADGGALALFDDEDIEFDEDRSRTSQNTTINRNRPTSVSLQNNYFSGNSSSNGQNIYSAGYDGSIDVSNSHFDNIDCSTNEVNDFILTSYNEDADFVQENIYGVCIEENTFYISSNGDDSNMGTESEPFLTIGRALGLVKTTGETTIIRVLEGLYSPSTTGEKFPVTLPDNVHLIGSSSENTVLDAEASIDNQRRVVLVENSENVMVSNFTLTGGFDEESGCHGGGGLSLIFPDADPNGDMYNTNAAFENLIIKNNHAFVGGGISVFRLSGAAFENIEVLNNTAAYMGGGVFLQKGVAAFKQMVIAENENGYQQQGRQGGGMMFAFSGGTLEDVIIKDNITGDSGGGLWINNGIGLTFDKVTITNNTSTYNGAGIALMQSEPIGMTRTTIANNFIAGDANGNVGQGDGMWSMFTNVAISNSIFYGNTGTGNEVVRMGGDYFYIVYSLTGDEATYSDYSLGSITGNPLFIDAENDDYSLQDDSPCIDAGTVDISFAGYEAYIDDYFGLAPDMGSHEWVSPSVNNVSIFVTASSITLSWDVYSDPELQYYAVEYSTDPEFMNGVESIFGTENYLVLDQDDLEYDTEYFFRVLAFTNFWSLPSDMLSGTLEFLEINNDNELPISFSLNQNYPNPFNPTTNINYSIPSDNFVTVTVYNVMGEKIKTLSNGFAASGHKSVKWNAQNERGQEVSAGLYVYTIEAGDFRDTKKMLLLK